MNKIVFKAVTEAAQRREELGSEKVELSALSDLKSGINKVFSALRKNQKDQAALVDARNKLRDNNRELNKVGDALEASMDNLSKAANELGLSAAEIQEWRDAKDAINSIGKAIMENQSLGAK